MCALQVQPHAKAKEWEEEKYSRKCFEANKKKQNTEIKCIYDNRLGCNRDFVAAAFYLHSNGKKYGRKENTNL